MRLQIFKFFLEYQNLNKIILKFPHSKKHHIFANNLFCVKILFVKLLYIFHG
jgi:hypothetical protein